MADPTQGQGCELPELTEDEIKVIQTQLLALLLRVDRTTLEPEGQRYFDAAQSARSKLHAAQNPRLLATRKALEGGSP